jgi:eukaryotic-like serine/threonine-protein kinase
LTLPKTVLASPAQLDPLVGKTLGAFRVLGPLGGGGMAQLYRGEEIDTGKPVAIKVLLEGMDDPTAARRMIEEARAVIAVKHPNIIELYSLGHLEGDRRPYLVMELLEGRSLFELQEKLKGKLSVPQALNVLDQILAGLVAAHAAGIVHRDLKPENIFVVDRPEGWKLKILDFGLALRRDEEGNESSRLTAAGAVVGTPQFMAPEQASGEGPMTDKTDVYALGAMAYVLLTGRELFGGGTMAQIMIRQIEEPAPPLRPLAPEVPEALEALVLQMLEKDQAARPTAAEARAQVQALLTAPRRTNSGSQTVVQAPKRTNSGQRPAVAKPKSRLPIFAAIGAAMVLAVGVGAFFGMRKRSAQPVPPPVEAKPALVVAPAPPVPEPAPVAPEPAPAPPPEPDTSHSWRCAQIQTVGKVKKVKGGSELEVRFARGAALHIEGTASALDGFRESVLRCKLKKKKLSATRTQDNATRALSSDLKVE